MPDPKETPDASASKPDSTVQINENGLLIQDGKDTVRINLHGIQITSSDTGRQSAQTDGDSDASDMQVASQSQPGVIQIEASPVKPVSPEQTGSSAQSIALTLAAALLIAALVALLWRLRKRSARPDRTTPPTPPAGEASRPGDTDEAASGSPATTVISRPGKEIRISGDSTVVLKPGKEVRITPEGVEITKQGKTVRIDTGVSPASPPVPPSPPAPPEAPAQPAGEAAARVAPVPGQLALFVIAALFIRALVQHWHIPGWYGTALQILLALSMLWLQLEPAPGLTALQEQGRRLWNYCAAWLVAVRWQRLLGFSVCAWLALDALASALFGRYSTGNALFGLLMGFVSWRIAARVPVQLPRREGWANVRRFRPLEIIVLVACFCLAVFVWPQKDRSPSEPWSFGIVNIEPSAEDKADAADRQAREAERKARIAERKAERHARGSASGDDDLSSGIAFFGLFLALLAFKLLAGDKIKAEEAADSARSAADMARNDADMAALQREAADARLAAMQAQIEPHFLFNTLASIDQLIQTDPARASQLQKNLIRYLREAVPQIREDAQRSTLGKQLAMSRAYVEIMQMRMEERLQAEFHISEGLHAAEFPSMMLQTLIENAIKHGLEPRPEGGRLIVSAEVGRNQLVVRVEDNGMGCDPALASDGTGLANIRERLRLLYGERALFSLQSREGGGAIARIQLPYIDEAPPAAPAQG